ncbi:MAG: hypothetical protein GX595_06660, partial [Lentisphaerae bacterium]|nr:hypothetical protein [Lentisphaerota bacterium]
GEPTPAGDVHDLARLLAGALAPVPAAAPAAGAEGLPLAALDAGGNAALAGALSADPSRRPGSCRALVEACRARLVPTAAAGVAAAPMAAPTAAALPAAAPRPASPAGARPAVVSPPRVPSQHRPTVSPSRRRGGPRPVDVALGVAAVLLLSLAGLWFWSQRASRSVSVTGEAPWTTVAEEGRLAARFASVLTVEATGEVPPLRCRLLGQTRRLDLVVRGTTVEAVQTLGPGQATRLAEAILPAACQAGDVLAVVASPSSIDLFVNGIRVLAAPWPMEALHSVLWQVPPGAASPGRVRLQKIGTLLFADDFMHGENDLGEWQARSGTWTVHALQNPIRSANPFSFLGQGDDALATAGYWFWRDYRLAFSAHPLPGTAFGAKLCWVSPELGYELLWSQPAAGPGQLSLRRVAGSSRQDLAQVELSFAPAQWYRLEVSQVAGVFHVRIDGSIVLSALDPAPLLGGAVGLWSRGGEGTVFDDVVVSPVEEVHFDFSRQSSRGVSLLRPVGPGASSGGAAAGEGFDVGGVVLENARVAVQLDGLPALSPGDGLELLARRRAGEELALRVHRGRDGWQARIVSRQVGQEAVLAEAPLGLPGAESRVSLHVLGGEAWGVVNGAMVVLASDVPVRGQGTVGLRLPAAGGVTRRSLEVCAEKPLTELENRVEMFTHEESMQSWSSPVQEWRPEPGGRWATYWHRSDFWQDLVAVLRVAALPSADAPEAVGLALRAPSAAGDAAASAGLALVIDPEAHRLQLVGLPQGPRELSLLKQRVQELALERRGGRVLARLNGQVVWNELLPDDLRGLCEIGRFGRGNTKEWAEAVTLRAGGVAVYPFKQAPVDWFPVTGVWEVTNRWQCDPRWSFYSGVQRGGVACNWNKVRHGENVTVEFFAGPKMDQNRGRKYEYAADINAVLCADGRDLVSGYSFLFGGWDDRGSQIVRGHEIVGENRRVAIPRDSTTHRRWFYIKLRKAGNRLSFWVDGTLVATYEDAKPLSGDRFGLWTWDNGIMVAQCRVSTDGPGLAAAPVASHLMAAPKTPYDKP